MNLSRTELLNKLRGMDEYEFEELVADVWSERGWDTRVTTGSNDRGIDVIAEKHSPFHQKQLIQAKRYSTDNKIGSPDIQQYSSLRQQESDVDAIVVVTTSSFSKQAQRMADDLNVKLISGESFAELISDIGTENFKSRINSSTAETESTNTTNNLKKVSQSQNTQSEKNRRRLKKELNEQTNNRGNWDTDGKKCGINTTASETVCPNCKKEIKRTGWFAYVSHFESCGVPSTKPSGMSDELWTKIVDKLKERGVESSNGFVQEDKRSVDKVRTDKRPECPHCGKEFQRNGWFQYVSHFEDCDKTRASTANRPQGVPDETWSEVVKRVKDKYNYQINSETNCKFCYQKISDDLNSHIEHWNTCKLTRSSRPKHISVGAWLVINDSVEIDETVESPHKQKLQSKTRCEACNQEIIASKYAHIVHWRECELPDFKPRHISMGTWLDICNKVKISNNKE